MKFRDREFEEKLFRLKDSRDSIVDTSAWALNFPEYHAEMASLWLTVFKKVNPSHQISLFYLANDVVQNSRKQSLCFSSSFLPAIKDALTVVRHDSAKAKLSRVLNVWDERRIFKRDDIVDMIRTLNGGVTDSKLVENFQPSELYVKLKTCDQLEDLSNGSMRQIKNGDLQRLTNVHEMRLDLKDRSSGQELADEVESMYERVKSVVENLDKENKERVQLLELLSVAEAHYENERREAKMVANAYKCFGSKVKNVKKALEEKTKLLSSTDDSSLTLSLNPSLSFKHDELAKSFMLASGLFQKSPLQIANDSGVSEVHCGHPSATDRFVPPLKPPPTPHSDLLQQFPDSTTEDLLSPESPPPFEQTPTNVFPAMYLESRDVDMRRMDLSGAWSYLSSSVSRDQ